VIGSVWRRRNRFKRFPNLSLAQLTWLKESVGKARSGEMFIEKAGPIET